VELGLETLESMAAKKSKSKKTKNVFLLLGGADIKEKLP
jgi:hypothetical protein